MDRRTYPLCQITSAIKKYWCKLNLELNLGVRKDEDNRLTRRGLLRIPGRAGPAPPEPRPGALESVEEAREGAVSGRERGSGEHRRGVVR